MLLRPQFPDEEVVYQFSNGRRKLLSSRTSMQYRLLTDWQNTRFHECFKAALSHDDVFINNDLYTGEIVKTGAYELEWPEFQNINLGQATVEVSPTPYSARNTHCEDCSDAEQMSLQHDIFPGTLEGDVEYVLNVATNDSVLCLPYTYSILSINTSYVASASITAAGVLTLRLKEVVPAGTNIALITYKVTCANGQFST
ncbi:MAG TPA: hypothetical protein PKD72_05040, partial [Gemmatales bacterium]|nr:hypothetical protein [Gemmatales bacterium]